MSRSQAQRISNFYHNNPKNPLIKDILQWLNKVAYDDQIYLKEGIFHLRKTHKPFSGVWHDTNNLIKGTFKFGLKTGHWVEYIDPSAYEKETIKKVTSSGFYLKGYKEGVWVEYWETSNNLRYRRSGFYRQGQKPNEWIEWQWSDYDLGWVLHKSAPPKI